MNLAVFTFLISIFAVHSFSVYEVDCGDGGEIDTWKSSQEFYTACQLYHVRITNNFTKIKIYNNDEQNFTAVLSDHCKFQVFPAELFEQLPKIQYISFRDAGIKEIREFSFKNATNLKKLVLSSNKLTEIGENTFRGASKLEFLWLWSNNIKNISPNAFETLTNLRWLALLYNKLEVIETEIFAPLVNLQCVYLGSNQIKSVAPNAFVKNLVLNEIYLNNNPLKELELEIESTLSMLYLYNSQLNRLTVTAKNSTAKMFEINAGSNNLTNIDIDPKLGVRKLELAGNKIKSLEPFLELSSLLHINLYTNLLTDLTNIHKLSGLLHLRVGNNKNINLTPGIFSSLTKLKLLSLADINMTEFKFDWFGRRLEQLQTLELDMNQLKELDYAVLDRRFPALKEIKINENLFNCSFLEQMMSYWKNYTEIEVLDAYSDDSSQNFDKILCIKEFEEESSFFWSFLIVMVVVIVGAGFVYLGYKKEWKLPSQLDICTSVRNVRVVRRDNGLVRLVPDEIQ